MTLPHHALDRVGHFVEAVGRALLLSQTQDTQVVALTMLDHCDDLASERYFSNSEIYFLSVHMSVKDRNIRKNEKALTVARANLGKHNVALFVNLDIPDAITAPVTQEHSNFLARATL